MSEDRQRWDQRRRSMTLAERDREYSPSSCLRGGDYGPFIAAYQKQSDAAWASLVADDRVATGVVSYGDRPSNTIDLAVPTQPRSVPLIVFFHGGYWQELSKVESRFAARDCLDRGWAFAAVDYTLAPAVRLDAIVAECRAALRVLRSDADHMGIDPNRIVVAGSSAGAHLAAMIATDPHPEASPLAGTVLVSGIYELEPLVGTSIDGALHLDQAAVARNSPMRHDLRGFPPTILAWGDIETEEFKTQSKMFADLLAGHGSSVATLEIPQRNHFDVILDLATPDTSLGDAVATLVSGTDAVTRSDEADEPNTSSGDG